MVESEFAFPATIGLYRGVQSNSVDDIIELRRACEWTPLLQGRVRIELLDDFGRIGDLDGGTIDGQYSEFAPFSKGEVVLEEANQFLTQLDESRGSELGSSAGERAFGDFAERQFGVVNGLEESVQFDLQRAFEEIETEED
jgi:hypothetical protein